MAERACRCRQRRGELDFIPRGAKLVLWGFPSTLVIAKNFEGEVAIALIGVKNDVATIVAA